MHGVFLLSVFSALQLSPDVLAHTGCLCDTAAVLGAATKEALYEWDNIQVSERELLKIPVLWHCVTGQVAGCSEHQEPLAQ
jgi:hypothetical protein